MEKEKGEIPIPTQYSERLRKAYKDVRKTYEEPKRERPERRERGRMERKEMRMSPKVPAPKQQPTINK